MKLIFNHDEEEEIELQRERQRVAKEVSEEEVSQQAPPEKQRYFKFIESIGNL